MAEPKQIVLLGATGSIGENTCRVVERHPDRLRIAGAAANGRWRELAEVVKRFRIPHAALQSESAWREARKSGAFAGVNLLCGEEGIRQLATLPEAQVVVSAVAGTAGLQPTLAAIRAGKDIALANKEILVLTGQLMIAEAATHKARFLPVDSEHNAIFQCLHGSLRTPGVRRLWLTASGGPFRDTPLSVLAEVTPAMASAHPNWDMGPKVTIDSATMANKGLEMIEARWLFGVEPEQIAVVVHPQSIVHSMVEFVDGSFLAQLSPPSMTFAIQYCLLYPDRTEGTTPSLDFGEAMSLDFSPPDLSRFPCLRLAREALTAGGVAPAVFNAANEIAVERFLANRLRFDEIPRLIEGVLGRIPSRSADSLEEILEIDREARLLAQAF